MSLKSEMPRIKKKRRVAGDGWVSYNRVLIGNNASKKNIGRNPNFDTDETKLLIQLWGDPKVQRTLITTHKKHSVICQLAARMQEYGYCRSPEEITTRIKNLKCFYNRLKKDMESGQTSDAEPTWRHFAEMDAIMTRPIFSVRPNEVPQPSLKYQMEQKRQEREERKKKVAEEGGAVSESEDSNNDNGNDSEIAIQSNVQEIDDGIIPDVEVDMDINDETFAAITAVEASAMSSVSKLKITNGEIESDGIDGDNDDDDDDEKSLHIKEEDEDEEEEFETESNKSGNEGNALIRGRTQSNESVLKSTEENKEFLATSTASVTMATMTATSTNTMTTKPNARLKEDSVLIIPKEEPIDVDNDFENDNINIDGKEKSNVGKLMPTLAEMLKITKCNSVNTTKSVTAPATNLSSVTTLTSIALTTSSTSAATITATSKNSIQSTAPTGKISLVPASFLLPQSTTASATPTIGSSTLATPQVQLLPNVRSNTTAQMSRLVSAAPAGIVATGPGGMKVLLVNADQTDTSNSLQQKLQLQTAVGSHQQQFHQILQNKKQSNTQHSQMQSQRDEKRRQKKKAKSLPRLLPQPTVQQQPTLTISTENGADVSCKEFAPGPTRQLMRKLHDALEENNDIQRKRLRLENERLETDRSALDIERQRLALERERLDFERTAFERLLSMLPIMLQQQQSQPQTPVPQAERFVTAAPTTMIFNPPKLVFSAASGAAFATSVPAVTAATAVFAPANNFTPPSLTGTPATVVSPQVEICTPIKEFQLVTPKLEREE